jgi:hypothetical protein
VTMMWWSLCLREWNFLCAQTCAPVATESRQNAPPHTVTVRSVLEGVIQISLNLLRVK